MVYTAKQMLSHIMFSLHDDAPTGDICHHDFIFYKEFIFICFSPKQSRSNVLVMQEHNDSALVGYRVLVFVFKYVILTFIMVMESVISGSKPIIRNLIIDPAYCAAIS